MSSVATSIAAGVVAPDRYISAVLERHAVRRERAERAAAGLEPLVRGWAGQHFLGQSLSGSFAKGTATALSTDVDVFISLEHSAGPTMKEVYWGLYQHCAQQGLRPRAQNVSIRVEFEALKVDLVPGRKQPGDGGDHSLYRRKKDSWVQTNVARHVRLIADSSRTAEIRALKIWRERNFLDLPSFYLELAVLEALYKRPAAALAENVLAALAYLGQQFSHARIVDPANSNNVISDDLGAEEKRVIEVAARKSLGMSSWERVLW